MKKVILSEKQIKTLIGNLVINEQESPLPNQNNDNVTYQLCNHFIIKMGDEWFFEDNKGQKIRVPLMSEIKGTITKKYDGSEFTKAYRYEDPVKWYIKFDDIVLNGWEVGTIINKESSCYDYLNLKGGQPFCYIDETKSGGIPVFTTLFWIKNFDHVNDEDEATLRELPDKNGQVIQFYKTYTQRFALHVNSLLEGKIYVKPEEKPKKEDTTKTNPIILTFEKGLNDAFNFNDVTLNPTGNQNLQDLINYAKENYKGISANVPVICSSSIDGDPKQMIKGGMTREQYDMDLSKRRSEAIANILTTQVGIDTLKFVPQGIGETDQYDPGKKWPEIKDNKLTAGNRKLIIKLPKLQKTIQQQPRKYNFGGIKTN